MNVFEVQRAELTAKCFDEAAGGTPFTELEAARLCVLGVKSDLSASLYVYPMSIWTEHVANPSQFFVLQSEELFENPVAAAQRVALFAEVPPFEHNDFHIVRDIGE